MRVSDLGDECGSRIGTQTPRSTQDRIACPVSRLSAPACHEVEEIPPLGGEMGWSHAAGAAIGMNRTVRGHSRPFSVVMVRKMTTSGGSLESPDRVIADKRTHRD